MKLPRIMIAGTSSGSGKTTMALAVLSLMKRRDLPVRAYKCGPDYIDPMFHRTVTGIPCTNLDPFFCDGEMLRGLLAAYADGGTALIEGVMGYYDGTGEDGTENSSYTVAAATKSPVILTVDARGAAASVLAVIEGFLRFRPDSGIAGVLLNRISAMNYRNVERLIRAHFGERILPLGYLQELPDACRLPSRHLGLVTAEEIKDLKERLKKLSELAAQTIDLDALLALSDTAPALLGTLPEVPRLQPVTLAAARDAAFCFYYPETLRLFEKMGAQLLFFSPLAGETVPEEADGLLIGGGYPELYTETLEANRETKESIARAVYDGMPVIAECGGFQYLGAELSGRKMCGVLDHQSINTGKLVRFGYITLEARHAGIFGPAGTRLKAHEFHYYDSTENGSAFRAVKPNGRSWDAAVMTETMYAGYPHLYLPANVAAAEAFYRKCLAYREGRK